MKQITSLFTAIAFLAIATSASAQTSYGKKFKAENAKTPEELTQSLNTQPNISNVVVKGQIAQVCQAEGCWLKIRNPVGESVMVRFKNHSFFVPKDIAGKNVIVYGTASKKVVSVEERKHLAEDAGSAPADIAAITTPKNELQIEATGVVVN